MKSRTVNRATLRHPSTISKIRNTIKTATERALSDVTGVCVVDVYSARGKHFLSVCGIRGKGYRVCDSEGIEVTDLIKRTLGEKETVDNC